MEVYIILTKIGTILSNIIKIIKRHKYTHVSISLDRELSLMYSFGRLNPYIAFWGGFVHESIKWGTFKRFKNTKCVVLKLIVSDDEYHKLEELIEYFKENHKDYGFNVLGLIYILFNKRRKHEKKFYCAEFVKYMLDEAKIKHNLPDIVTPQDFFNISPLVVYDGKLSECPYQ